MSVISFFSCIRAAAAASGSQSVSHNVHSTNMQIRHCEAETEEQTRAFFGVEIY